MRLISVSGMLFPDVPINFEFNPQFVPSIFIVGGMQGSGKTTFLERLMFNSTNHTLKTVYEKENKGGIYLASNIEYAGHANSTLKYNWRNGKEKYQQVMSWVESIPDESLILFDNLEDGFHPDYQFKIGIDLEKRIGKSQMIIATHSYELCTTLTPSHVYNIDTPVELIAMAKQKRC